MATYSLSITGQGAHNPFGPKNRFIDDVFSNTPQQEQQSMAEGTSFLVKGPDGALERHVFDAERSIPGVLRITRKV